MENEALTDNLISILEGLDESQEKLEKNAFDVINSSDTSLNLVKESIGSVNEILKMIDELNAVVEESAKRISRLEELSLEIEKFTQMIGAVSNEKSKDIAITTKQVKRSVEDTVNSMKVVYDNAVAQKEKADAVKQVLRTVVDAALKANELARNIENEIAYQREITDEVRNALKE